MVDMKNLGRSLLIRCTAILLVGFLMSFLVITAFAATSVTGTSWAFSLGGKDYVNYSKLSYGNLESFIAATSVDCKTSSCDTGYLGAKPNIYKKNSSGTYSLVASGVWRYASTSCWAYTNGATTYDNPASGEYMCQGQSAVYYNGSYQVDWTYATPYITIS